MQAEVDRLRQEAEADAQALRDEARRTLERAHESEDGALELVRHARSAKETYEKATEEYEEATKATRSVQVLNMDGQTFLDKLFDAAERKFRDLGRDKFADYIKEFRETISGRPGSGHDGLGLG